jgi:hypothetical protein
MSLFLFLCSMRSNLSLGNQHGHNRPRTAGPQRARQRLKASDSSSPRPSCYPRILMPASSRFKQRILSGQVVSEDQHPDSLLCLTMHTNSTPPHIHVVVHDRRPALAPNVRQPNCKEISREPLFRPNRADRPGDSIYSGAVIYSPTVASCLVWILDWLYHISPYCTRLTSED